MIETLTLIGNLCADALRLVTPHKLIRPNEYRFAFLVHPRSRKDLFRKVPFLRVAPEWVVQLFERWWPPAVVSPITGLTDQEGRPVTGLVIGIPMSPHLMLQNRPAALAQIRNGVRLARAHGARIIGLGALTSSLSKGGLDLTDLADIAVTTGHAHTGLTVSETLRALIDRAHVPYEKAPVAIVGAAGSIGRICAELLAAAGIQRLLLVDLQRKHEAVRALADHLTKEHPLLVVEVTDELDRLSDYPFVITATNAEGALVAPEHVRPGTVIVDDAQPSDVAPELWESSDVLVVSAGAVHTPGISANFKMGLAGPEDNYCCLAEVMVLAHQRYQNHFVLHRPTLELVEQVAHGSKKLGFHVADFQTPHGYIPTEKIDSILAVTQRRCTV